MTLKPNEDPGTFETVDPAMKLQQMKGANKRRTFESFIPLFVYEFRRRRGL